MKLAILMVLDYYPCVHVSHKMLKVEAFKDDMFQFQPN